MGSCTSSKSDSKQAPERSQLLPAMLEELLPRDVAHIVAGYAVQLPHRWVSSSQYVSVRPDGRSFTGASGMEMSDSAQCYVWSTRSLAEGPVSWRVVLPRRQQAVWLGVGDLRTRHAASPNCLYIGNSVGDSVVAYGAIGDSTRHLVGIPALDTLWSGPRRAVLFEYDRARGQLRIGVEGEDPPKPIFGGLPDPQELAPLAIVSAETLARGAAYFSEADE